MKFLLLLNTISSQLIGSNFVNKLVSNQPRCPFGLTGNNENGCLDPSQITIAPPKKKPVVITQQFSNKTILTVIAANSNMAGDIKCTGQDDQIAIQKAIDNMNSTGGTVILSDGTFNLNFQIILCDDLTLVGQGMNTTILFLQNNAMTYTSAGTIRGRFISNLVIRDLQVNGNRQNNQGNAYIPLTPAYGKFGIFCEACNNVLFERVGAISNTGYGFDPHGVGSTMIGSHNLTIIDCWAYDNNWDGFALDKIYSGVIQNSWAVGNGRHGINVITGTSDFTVKNNFVYDNGFFYMKGTPGNGITVQSNTGLVGTFVYKTKGITVINNTIARSRGSGIVFSLSRQCSATQNTITGIGYCIGAISSINTIIRSNQCIGGLGLKSINNTALISDITSNKPSISGAISYTYIYVSSYISYFIIFQ